MFIFTFVLQLKCERKALKLLQVQVDSGKRDLPDALLKTCKFDNVAINKFYLSSILLLVCTEFYP